MTKEKEQQTMFDHMTIVEIESYLRKCFQQSKEAQKDFITGLAILKYSGRWKENSNYKKSSFKEYLLGEFNMRLTTFEEMCYAYTHFENETKRFGVGVIAKIKRQCGIAKEKKVLDEIKGAIPIGKPINQNRIEKIIQRHAKPKNNKVEPYIDWKNKYILEVEAHNVTKKELTEAKKQIEKLKRTILELQPLREMKEAIKPYMIAAMQ